MHSVQVKLFQIQRLFVEWTSCVYSICFLKLTLIAFFTDQIMVCIHGSLVSLKFLSLVWFDTSQVWINTRLLWIYTITSLSKYPGRKSKGCLWNGMAVCIQFAICGKHLIAFFTVQTIVCIIILCHLYLYSSISLVWFDTNQVWINTRLLWIYTITNDKP